MKLLYSPFTIYYLLHGPAPKRELHKKENPAGIQGFHRDGRLIIYQPHGWIVSIEW
jgi:hypothetical protein